MSPRVGVSVFPERRLTLWATSLVVFLIDQITKMGALQCSAPGEYTALIPGWLGVVPIANHGMALEAAAAVSASGDAWALASITLVVIAAITYFLYLHFSRDQVAQLGLALLLGGAAGNTFDRLRLGHVIDFLHINLTSVNCPVFNVADLAVVFAVVILVFRYK